MLNEYNCWMQERIVKNTAGLFLDNVYDSEAAKKFSVNGISFEESLWIKTLHFGANIWHTKNLPANVNADDAKGKYDSPHLNYFAFPSLKTIIIDNESASIYFPGGDWDYKIPKISTLIIGNRQYKVCRDNVDGRANERQYIKISGSNEICFYVDGGKPCTYGGEELNVIPKIIEREFCGKPPH